MEEQLPGTPWKHGLNGRKMYIALYILCQMIWGAAHSQPRMISEISKTSKNFVGVNGRLYYSTSDSLMASTSSTSPVLVKKTGQPILKIYPLTIGSSFFFVTQNGAGQTLWRTDGTTGNTSAVVTQASIVPLQSYHGQLFMKVVSGSGGELWKVDGAFAPSLVKDINPGAGNGFVGQELVIHNDLLWFFGSTGELPDLWRSDGTTAGTVMAVDLDNTVYYNMSGYYGLTSALNALFFARSYEGNDYGDIALELWKSDGTQTGTSIIQSSTAYTYNFYSHFVPLNGKLYFYHTMWDPQYLYLSVTDGTAAGTHHIEQVSIDGNPEALMAAGSYILYYASSQGFITPIKKYDGTASSIVHSFSYYYQNSASNISLTYTNGRAFFVDDVDAYGGTEKPRSSQLWQADLAAGVTQPVQDIWNIPLPNTGNIVAMGSSVFFTRLISNRLTLWFYDPTIPPTPSLCENVGYIEREKWTNITGYQISSIPGTAQPNAVNVLSSFTTKQNDGDNYGARVRGYVCPPQTGNYTFYISSDDNAELWLSSDDNPSNKKLIASSKWTNYNEWTKYPSQQSAAIPLVAGVNYYIEALHKEATGADHLSVGWRLPNATLERPIPGMRLIPFQRNNPPNVYIVQPADNATFTAPATVDIEANAWDRDGSVTKVQFYVGTTLLGEDTTSPYTVSWKNVAAGTYNVEARATDDQGFVTKDFQTVTVSPGCGGTGKIYQELWVKVPSQVDVISFNWDGYPPNGGSRVFSNFETDQYYGNNYASRMRGWICAPQTGEYTFWISSDDGSELYLSTDETVANRRIIAWVYGATPFRNYDKYPSQRSTKIYLVAGQKYYVEARHREYSGNDFLSVGWQLPDGTLERPMTGSHLIPIVPASEPVACSGTGRIVREIWTGVTGTSVSNIPVNSPPNMTVNLTSLSTPNYYGNDYGSRIRGYLCAPATGVYKFYISSDDNSELWLSDSDDPATKKKIAFVLGATAVNQWDKYTSQQSVGISLVQGQRYYVEVLHKEGNGADHVEVGWDLPSGTAEKPIPGTRLIPYDAATTATAVATDVVNSAELTGSIEVYPNPVGNDRRFSVTIPSGVSGDVSVNIISVAGVVLQGVNVTSDEEISIELQPNIGSGLYVLELRNNKRRWITKLQVK